MPHSIVTDGKVLRAHLDFETALNDILQLRSEGLKPRLFYSTTFATVGVELDDQGVSIEDFTRMSWCAFQDVLSNIDTPWSDDDDDFLLTDHRSVSVFGMIAGRPRLIAEIVYSRGESTPASLNVRTPVLRILRGLMDPSDF